MSKILKTIIRDWVVKRQNTLAKLVTFALSRNGERIAVVDGNRRITYQTLQEKVYQAVGWLHQQGMHSGHRIAAMFPDSLDFMVLRLACHIAGVETVMILDTVQEKDLQHILASTSPMALVHSEEISPLCSYIPRKLFSIRTMPGGHTPTRLPNTDHPATINFSSGTTGHPKGIILNQGNWAASCHAFVKAADIAGSEQQAYLSVIPMAVAGSTSIVPALLGGMKIVLAHSHDPATIVALIEEESIHFMFLTPTWLSELTQYVARSKTRIESLNKIAVGTDTVHAGMLKRAIQTFGPIVSCGYGMAEVLPPLTLLGPSDYMRKGEIREGRLHSVGRPYPHVTIRIHNNGLELPVGTPGEIELAATTRASGYIGTSEQESQRFREGSFFSEDFGYLDDEGYLFILGRESHRLDTSKGSPIFARKLEDICLEEDGIALACAVQTPTGIGIALTPDQEDRTDNSILEKLKQKLYHTFQQEVSLQTVKRMPTTQAGKMDRSRVRELFEEKGETSWPK